MKITSWSFSRYAVYKLCALKAKLAFIDKIKEPSNQAMERGDKIHKMAEAYVKGDLRKLPPELQLVEKEIKLIRDLFKKKTRQPVIEETWAFTKSWDQTTWNDWANCWLRIKVDCAHYVEDDVMMVTDWKTGKLRSDNIEDYLEQLQLYALGALLLYGHVNCVRTRLVYTDLGKTYPEDGFVEYKRSDLSRLKKIWEGRVKKMLSDTVFKPTPNSKCAWCFYSSANKANGGGQCKF